MEAQSCVAVALMDRWQALCRLFVGILRKLSAAIMRSGSAGPDQSNELLINKTQYGWVGDDDDRRDELAGCADRFAMGERCDSLLNIEGKEAIEG